MAAFGMELRKSTVMGKFDGYLICSDFDGTFAHKTEPVEANLPAVRYFTQNGGRFTVATGRTMDFIREKKLTELINAPACLFNGSVVYDYAKGETLRALHLPFTVGDALRLMGEQLSLADKVDIFDAPVSVSRLDISGLSAAQLEQKPLKLLFRFLTPELADEFKAAAEEKLAGQCYISKSFPLCVELNPSEGTKGHALAFIKNSLPGVHTAIGVGDNDNDRILLEYADVGAAPENAVDSVKELADIHLRPCTQGTIAHLIEILDRKLK